MLFLNKCKKGARGHYCIIRQKFKNEHTMKEKWEHDLNLISDSKTWHEIF